MFDLLQAENRPDCAKYMVQHIGPIFPLRPRTKEPFAGGGPNTATTDVDRIRVIFDEEPNANYAISTDNLAVVDVDTANGMPGLENWEKLKAKYGDFDTFTVQTARGGLHIYFETEEPVGQADLAPGVNVRGKGGYIVGPGSVFQGGTYEIINDAPLMKLSGDFATLFSRPGETRDIEFNAVCELDLPGNVDRAIEYAVVGEPVMHGTRNNTGFKVACLMKDLGLSEEMIAEIMLEHWNERCEPTLSNYEIEKLARQAYTCGRSAPGCMSPQADFIEVAGIAAEIEREFQNVQKLTFRSAERWVGRTPTPSRFVIDKLVPLGFVTLLVSAGGRGKTLLMQTMMTCIAGNRPFLGLDVEEGEAIGLFCEDDDDELHRRQERICNEYDVDFSQVAARLFPTSGVGYDTILYEPNKWTELFDQIESELQARPNVKFLGIDGVAHTFAESENDRGAVTRFIGKLTGLASRYEVAIVLITHESKSSATNDTHAASGSTAWLNATRSVLKLDKVDKTENQRMLKQVKTNRGELASSIRCDFRNGVLVRSDVSMHRERECIEYTQEVIAACIQAGQKVSPHHRASNWAVTVVEQSQPQSGHRFDKHEIKEAFKTLHGSYFHSQKYESNGRWPTKLVLAPEFQTDTTDVSDGSPTVSISDGSDGGRRLA